MMRFIVDAHLPKRLSDLLIEMGYDSIHTFDLIDKNATDDNIIRKISVNESRVVITKDSDFEDSFLLQRIPPKLLLVTTGNIQNKHLIKLFLDNIVEITNLFEDNNFIEIDRNEITVHS
jgi:predicted nuclease of predicted toxin-antitoxin system